MRILPFFLDYLSFIRLEITEIGMRVRFTVDLTKSIEVPTESYLAKEENGVQ